MGLISLQCLTINFLLVMKNFKELLDSLNLEELSSREELAVMETQAHDPYTDRDEPGMLLLVWKIAD